MNSRKIVWGKSTRKTIFNESAWLDDRKYAIEQVVAKCFQDLKDYWLEVQGFCKKIINNNGDYLKQKAIDWLYNDVFDFSNGSLYSLNDDTIVKWCDQSLNILGQYCLEASSNDIGVGTKDAFNLQMALESVAATAVELQNNLPELSNDLQDEIFNCSSYPFDKPFIEEVDFFNFINSAIKKIRGFTLGTKDSYIISDVDAELIKKLQKAISQPLTKSKFKVGHELARPLYRLKPKQSHIRVAENVNIDYRKAKRLKENQNSY